MKNPVSTYRIQFHKGFNFENFEKALSYLQELGVSTVYASPIFEATPGSTHGYDGLNPHRINPEIGNEEQFRNLIARIKEGGQQWLQDIVPNHMAFHCNNPWLMDVLEKGKQSSYASFFDIGWESPLYGGRVMVPFLGAVIDEVIEKKELKVDYQSGKLVLSYYDSFYPLNLRSYERILTSVEEPNQAFEQLLSQLAQIHQIEDAAIYSERWNEFLLQLSSLSKNEAVNASLRKRLDDVNSEIETVKEIAAEQYYQLCHWQETDHQINFRRFFTVNGLICLNIQDKKVFDVYHQYIHDLIKRELIDGLRVDHVDGLFDPGQYLQNLRTLAGEDSYIVVEKILETGEELERSWPIEGNSGYDFLAMVNNLFTDKEGEEEFSKFYKKLTGDKRPLPEQIHEKKSYILHQHMGGELDNLYQMLISSGLADPSEVELSGDLKAAIAGFLIHCPVYRYYANSFPLVDSEAQAVQSILNSVRKSKPALNRAVGLLEQIFLIKPQKEDGEYNAKALKFYQRCMQFTGPLMAKGVEDTLMYTYNRFVGHNEVGDSPEAFGYSADEFHQLMADRQLNWPLSVNGTSTHDTKRGEDVRARLNVLTELGEQWTETIKQWQFLNEDITRNSEISANEQYFIYQTIVGALPFNDGDQHDFESRIHEYLVKALREGKQNSDWASPNEAYENAAKDFASALLDRNRPFYKILQKFNRKIADFGIVNSLSQVLLKFTCPGVPDVYQGCELWDLSLVDPDNRRAVDYEKRYAILQQFKEDEDSGKLLEKLWESREEGGIKLWLTHKLLRLRKEHAGFFIEADYIPLKVKGKYKDHVFAFARRLQDQWVIAVIPLHLAKLGRLQKRAVRELKWKNTRVVLPENAPEEFEHLLLDFREKTGTELFIKQLFKKLPLAILKLQQPLSNRGAGVLMHITSLPSAFPIGDFGPGAKAFADFLSNGGQKYWQLLPLSPTGEGQGYSPYSAISTMAGNPLLISPELLVEDGLLEPSIIKRQKQKSRNKVDFAAAKRVKERLFDEAYHNFSNGRAPLLEREFDHFCVSESGWLDDFALYVALKQQNGGKPWYEWPDEFKLRDKMALEEFSENNQELIAKTKWLQFIFLRQWSALKQYCNNRNIQLFGDLPFYVSNDSADVWANKEIFSIDNEGKMTGLAGVPPDYFNSNGQLWGMPVFRWDVLKEQKYDWWIKRLKKNMQLYDLLRLDHFRAFSSYWDVPAGEDTAINGEWKQGPASDFFSVLKQEFGELPFVAEDLGDIDAPVYELRDEFKLPGMRVLQFTFGDDVAQSVHSPHNFVINSIAYTGTHDNNTTVGWFRQDADEQIRRHVEEYSGVPAKEKNIHLVLSKLAYSTVSKIIILPMQDVIGLDEEARMNTPASVENNWAWRLKSKQLKPKYSKRLKSWVKFYNR